MFKIFLILICFFASFLTQGLGGYPEAWGWECPEGGSLVLIAPHAGAHTFSDTIAVRGFVCDNHQLVLVKNTTTDKAVLTSTDENCDGEKCIYTFAAFVTDLALGVNDLEATIPGQDPPLGATVQIIRTALAEN